MVSVMLSVLLCNKEWKWAKVAAAEKVTETQSVCVWNWCLLQCLITPSLINTCTYFCILQGLDNHFNPSDHSNYMTRLQLPTTTVIKRLQQFMQLAVELLIQYVCYIGRWRMEWNWGRSRKRLLWTSSTEPADIVGVCVHCAVVSVAVVYIFCELMLSSSCCFQCFDAVGWASGL